MSTRCLLAILAVAAVAQLVMATGNLTANDVGEGETYSTFPVIVERIPSSGSNLRRLAHHNDTCWIANNIDMDDLNLLSVKKLPKEFCCFFCEEDDACHAWTWTEFEGGTCFLKERPSKATIKRGAQSGMVLTSSNSSYFWRMSSCDMPGSDAGTMPAADYTECSRMCLNNARCAAFSWSNYNGGTCWMKSDIRECVKVSGVTSGIVFKMFGR